MNTIDGKSFIEQFTGSNQQMEISDQLIDSEITFGESDFDCQYATIRNCHFKGSVSFVNVDLQVGVKFINCAFSKSLVFNNCVGEGYSQEFSFKGGNVIIESSTIESLRIFGDAIIDRGIRVTGGTKIKDCHFAQFATQSGTGVYLEMVEIEKSLDVKHLKLAGNFSIHSCTIHAWIRVWQINSAAFNFTKSEFFNDIYIGAGKIRSISISDSQFHGKVRLEGIGNCKKLTTVSNEFNEKFVVNYEGDEGVSFGGPDEYYIASSKLSSEMVVDGSNSYVRSVEFIGSANNVGTFEFNGCIFEKVLIRRSSHRADLNFNYCRFGELKFDHFFNYSNLTLSSCSAVERDDSAIILRNSNLGKMQLLNFLLNSFTKVEIQDSIFVDMNVSGVEWFDDHKLSTNPDAGIDLSKKREVYRQLKQVCERNGDKIQALNFRAKELSLFYQSMVQRRVPFFRGDRLSLWMSQSNNFGLDWKRATGLLLLITIGFFPLIVIAASPDFVLVPSQNPFHIFWTVLELWNNLEVLPQMLNPTRVLSRLFPATELRFSAHFFDTFHRLILAYLIVQIIAAFRKYIR